MTASLGNKELDNVEWTSVRSYLHRILAETYSWVDPILASPETSKLLREFAEEIKDIADGVTKELNEEIERREKLLRATILTLERLDGIGTS